MNKLLVYKFIITISLILNTLIDSVILNALFPQTNNCQGIANVRTLVGLAVPVREQPNATSREVGIAVETNGWFVVDQQQGTWWHICNWGWVPNDAVTVIVFPVTTESSPVAAATATAIPTPINTARTYIYQCQGEGEITITIKKK